jgi:hypothetical protein
LAAQVLIIVEIVEVQAVDLPAVMQTEHNPVDRELPTKDMRVEIA